MTQHDRILSYLRSHKRAGLTSMEAFIVIGTVNLPSRIGEMRRKGIKIQSEWVGSFNRYGQPIRYARYFLR